ncbi:MAG: DUF6261 family protein, partial [Alistipes sp.]|nr:DUF6261 family protein [Alistipes sp.]
MEKIRNVYLHNLRNDEHFQFVEFVLELVGEAGATVPGVEAQARALAAAHARENEALRKITRSALTAALAAAGRERAGVFRGMADTARAALHHFDHGARDAATRVGIVMDTYGNLAHISLVEATSATHNLLGELAAHRAADVAALGLGPWADELGRLNRRVERLLEERADEGAGRTPLVLKTVRTEVDAAYRALVEMVGARATVASPGA